MRFYLLALILLSSCTLTCIKVHTENGSTSVVDTSTSANPQVDPNVSIPALKAL